VSKCVYLSYIWKGDMEESISRKNLSENSKKLGRIKTENFRDSNLRRQNAYLMDLVKNIFNYSFYHCKICEIAMIQNDCIKWKHCVLCYTHYCDDCTEKYLPNEEFHQITCKDCKLKYNKIKLCDTKIKERI